MHKLPLITKNDEVHAKEKLETYYANDMIAAEKKTYLSKLGASEGPYLAVESNDPNKAHYLLDASSQIATLGLGFNSSVFMGSTQFLESWLNDPNGKDFRGLVKAYERFLQRKLEWEEVHLNFCHSGAEANEIALGHCYRKRKNRQAKKVICFEGSFHGRMLVSLFSSWNKSKRAPFELPGFEANYVPFPEIQQLSNGMNLSFPDKWAEIWDKSADKNFSVPKQWPLKEQDADSMLLQSEVDSLLKLREELLKSESFAVIVEPMQCEGGDRYASNRFHSALLLMCRAFEIPVIHDEVQTGFHLGQDFFWHRQLQLKGLREKNLSSVNDEKIELRERLSPDYITCAKKAQIGMVISEKKESTNKLHEAEFQVASVIRGYLHAIALDQSQPIILKIEQYAHSRLMALIEKHFDLIERPRINGLAFAFDLKDPSKLSEIIAKRFDHGLLYYPAGAKTLRFRLNTSYSQADIDFLFTQVENILMEVYRAQTPVKKQEVTTASRHTQEIIQWQHKILEQKCLSWRNESRPNNSDETEKELKTFFKNQLDLELVLINEGNFETYRDLIIELQKNNYEPVRQTSIETFEKTAKAPKGLCLGVKKKKKLLGIVFSAPLSVTPLDRGVRQDHFFGDDDVLYMVDTTIDKELQGQGLGRSLKYALSLLAQSRGRTRIQGRNRDRLAASMLNINLSLGGYEQNYIKDDYQDFERYRDVYYYTSPLTWNTPKLNLSKDLRSTISPEEITPDFIKDNFTVASNKICLSNFVSQNYLKKIRNAFSLMNKELRHGYSASGQSEAVDKVAKAIWYTKKSKTQSFKMLTFNGHYFGQGSFLSRSLSFANTKEEYFPVVQLECPTKDNEERLLEEIKKNLSKKDILAIWIEPLRQLDMIATPKNFLVKLKSLANKYDVAIVFNETASSFYRYNCEHFFPNNDPSLCPDAAFCYMGGQSALVYLKRNLFVEKPLMMISTWDGDEFSLGLYMHSAMKAIAKKEDYIQTRKEFEQKLTAILDQYENVTLELNNGVGHFYGPIPQALSSLFEKIGDKYRVAPSLNDMKKFLTEYV